MFNKTVETSAVLDLLDKYDPHDRRFGEGVTDTANLRQVLTEYFADKEERRAVLGIDIYQYSKMPVECQRLISTVFDLLRNATLNICRAHEFIFSDHAADGLSISTVTAVSKYFLHPCMASCSRSTSKAS